MIRSKLPFLILAAVLALALTGVASANRPDNETRRMHVTSYRVCDPSIAAVKACNGRTASGKPVQWGLAACGREFDFGTVFEVPEVGFFACYDRGWGVHNNLLDIFLPAEMGIGGSRWRDVIIRYDLEGEQVLQDALASIGESPVVSPGGASAPTRASAQTENLLGNALADTLRQHYNADIGLIHNGALHGGLTPEQLTATNVATVLPMAQRGVTLHLRGDVIKQILETSLAQDARTDLTLSLAGLNVVYNPTAPIGKRVVHLTRSDTQEPIWENASYFVALTDGLYLADPYHSLFETGRGFLTFEPAADTIGKWITGHGAPASQPGRIVSLK